MVKYDSYKDSRVEWIGEIPKHWDLTRLKFLCSICTGNKNTEDNIEDGLYPFFVRSPKVERINTYSFDGESVLTVGDGVGTGKVFHYIDGKFDFHQRVYKFSDFRKVNGKFFFWFIKNNFIYVSENQNSKSTVDSLRLPLIQNFTFVVPPLPEQHQIVQYLDTKTTQIDSLIQKTQEKINLLREKRTSLINHTVTKGLNPDVEMKDSGVEWIGEIPKHWDFVKVGHYTQIVRGGSPRPSGDPRFFDGDFIHWITVKEVTNKTGKYITTTDTKLTEEGMKQSRVLEPETLVLSNSGVTLGIPGILKIKGCINDGSVGFSSISPKVERDFLYYFWTTQTKLLLEQQSGYGQPNLNTDIISNVRFPLPPQNEQQQIVEYLDNQTQLLDTLIQKEEKRVELLKEYRQTLISDVVTGKIKVTYYE